MNFKEMDPAITLALLAEYEKEGHEDSLAKETEELEQFYATRTCPKCGGNAFQREYIRNHAFADRNHLVARATLQCKNCTCHWDPHSGLRLKEGNLALLEPPLHILGRNDEK